MSEQNLIAEATTTALINTLIVNEISVPSRILKDIKEMERETRQRVIKISAGFTNTKYVPDGAFPKGSEDEQWRWGFLRLSGELFTDKKYADWPRVKEILPKPCYILHLSDNGITAEAWLKDNGYEAMSAQPLRCSMSEKRHEA